MPGSSIAEGCSALLGDNALISFGAPSSIERLDDAPELYENIASPKTLEEEIAEQLPFIFPEGELSKISPYCLASLLDGRGFMNCGIAEAAAALGLSEEMAAAAIKTLQDNLEPPGLFAEDLKECLLIQLQRSRASERAVELLCDGEEYLISGRAAEFAAARGWNEGELKAALAALKRLDPAPGRSFAPVRYIFPEIEFRVLGEEVRPRLVSENIPTIENHFEDYDIPSELLLKEKWMLSEWRRARSVMKLAGLRYRTLMRAALIIARVQRAHIIDRSFPLSPLTYSSAASELGLSVSTLCRAMRSAWAICGGVSLPMSSFFVRGCGARPDLSVDQLRRTIADLGKNGLNSRQIAADTGIPIRTVSYHRAKIKSK